MTYEQCAEKGMTIKETAEAMGVRPSAVSGYAYRNGLTFRDGRYRQGTNQTRKPVQYHHKRLTPQERAEYDYFVRTKKLWAVEALTVIGRGDLIVEVKQ